MPSRPQLLVFHRRLALIIAPLLFLQALTGLALLFKNELGRLASPPPMQTATARNVPISTIVSGATEALPGYRVSRIFLPATPLDTAFVHLVTADGTTRYAAVDPGNGQALASGPVWRFPAEAALQIHYRLLDGRFGMAVVLVNGIALALMAATGMLYWWPGGRRIGKSLTIKASAPPRARLRQWHRSIGVILTPLVLFSATTGILLILPDLTAPQPPAASAPPPASAARIDTAFDRALAAAPDARVRDIRFPAADRIDVNFYAPRYNSQAVDLVSVRHSDGTVLKTMPAQDNPALWIAILPLHSGTEAGIAGRILLAIEGLALMILAVTGPLMWWQARRPKRRKP